MAGVKASYVTVEKPLCMIPVHTGDISPSRKNAAEAMSQCRLAAEWSMEAGMQILYACPCAK